LCPILSNSYLRGMDYAFVCRLLWKKILGCALHDIVADVSNKGAVFSRLIGYVMTDEGVLLLL